MIKKWKWKNNQQTIFCQCWINESDDEGDWFSSSAAAALAILAHLAWRLTQCANKAVAPYFDANRDEQ
jgi:hypothetical protein